MRTHARLTVLCAIVFFACYVSAGRHWHNFNNYDRHQIMQRQREHRSRGGRARRMGNLAPGPHRCSQGQSTFCCSGWKTQDGKNCNQPICEPNICGNDGICAQPNICLCPNGLLMPKCLMMEEEKSACGSKCLNDGVCDLLTNQCKCQIGFTGPHCQQDMCEKENCLNGGECKGGKCRCVYGFTGRQCERDFRKGPCFLTRRNGTCSNTLEGLSCTKLFCCATVGEGWGHPCEECPVRIGNCSIGRLPPHCLDIDECKVLGGICGGGTCVNTDGSFKCICPKGYKHDVVIHQCVDINECLEGACSGGECINTEGSFECHCPPLHKLSHNGAYCISDLPGRCYTAIESGMCASPLGDLVRRTMCCCVVHGQETLGKCFAAIGHGPERCATIGTPEYQRDCEGIDPEAGIRLCALYGAQACSNGRCVDQPELHDYYCECDDGYSQTHNRKQCIDTNECTENGQIRDICGDYGTCLNTDGSYVCHCDIGYENSPSSLIACIEIDECALNSALCDNGNCINTRGSFMCDCDTGFRASATKQRCDDIDECEETAGLCENGRCMNTIGYYSCICHPGFFLSPSGIECLDTNECEHDNMCANGDCVNMAGKFKCICHDGFELMENGRGCADINECLMMPCVNGRCENSIGSFSCHCHRFQVLDASGTRCVLDLTLGSCYRNVRNGQCRAHNALQMDTTRADCCCAVPDSTSAWGGSCEPCPERSDSDYATLCHEHDVTNICALLENPCENGDCIKMADNEYRCVCNSGFLPAQNQKSCIDIDECTQNQCSNGMCRNTPGSYQCTCDEGFVLIGNVCEDQDECTSNPCFDGRCVNMPGSYKCVCDDGYMLDVSGHICIGVSLGKCWREYSDGQCSVNVGAVEMTAEQCCNSIGEAWGSVNCVSCDSIELRCGKGYAYDVPSDTCRNIDECSLKICPEGSKCVDTDGSFICQCPPGYTLDANGIDCSDQRIGICFFSLSSQNTCSNPSGSFVSKVNCCCTGGAGWGDDCEDCPKEITPEYYALCAESITGVNNECIMFPELCYNGDCVNTDSSFVCKCNQGYTLTPDHRNCTDIDECSISPGLCRDGECENVDGQFVCHCHPGYKPDEELLICIDINECALPGYCTGGVCMNTIGGYECHCSNGRALSPDGKECIDVDECAVTPGLCEPNGHCENLLGHYMCRCNLGFVPTADSLDCVDVDECANNNGGCHMNCTNTIGSYQCSCEDGFVLAFDGHSCADRDECMEQMNRCDGGQCENTVGSFRCICFDGFMATKDLQFCDDIDECDMNSNICMHGRCHNTRGSYTCLCDDGYCVPQGQMLCVDEDECKMSKHKCHVNAECNNTEGAYDCECFDGFHGDGFMCHDDDECAEGTHLCHEFAVCTNKLGTYACECLTGYHGDGYSCSDNDDCIEDETLCGPNGQCLNVDGSFMCDCTMGFVQTADGKACKDVDECAFEQVCVKGRCHNMAGGFSCECLNGYQKDELGANCTDIDECEDAGNCINGNCINTDGSYECQCPDGFDKSLAGIGCIDKRTGDCFLHTEGTDESPICSHTIGVHVYKSVCCCSLGRTGGWGNPCEICPPVNTTEYNTLCPGGLGFMPNEINVLLEDIDECRTLPGLCRGGRCENVFGSFICTCPVGYTLETETRTCVDVDECTVADDICGPGGVCQNSDGGYNCKCGEGYKSVDGGRKCEDIRKASCHRYYNETSDTCSSELIFEETKKACCCYANIGEGWNTPCERCPLPGNDDFTDICGSSTFLTPDGICIKLPDLCKNGLCVPTNDDDGYRCECKKGFLFNEKLLICEDIDECLDEDVCFADAECSNSPGSFHCACRNGFVFDATTETCIDVDECARPETCSNGRCDNTNGGYVCHCNQGFEAINDETACKDINECLRNPCGPGICNNKYGTFMCICDTGYRLSDNGDCVDTNECDDPNQCQHGYCDNIPGGFTCDCDDGYITTPDKKNCIDKNECVEDVAACGVGSCQNMDGSYKCFCPEGYQSTNGTSCDDIDECLIPDMCKFGTCENLIGSFLCTCPPQFKLSNNKKYCIDMREEFCYQDYRNGVCSDKGSQPVSLSSCCCLCQDGGWGNDGGCQECPTNGTAEFDHLCPHGCGYDSLHKDIDECKSNPCTNGKCVNLAGSFKCICRRGYELDASNVACVDINECTATDNICEHGTCHNTEGNFECTCDEGFYNGPGIVCLDVNECASKRLHNCGFRCINTEGSFHCGCPNGFQIRPDGKMCEDINECATDLTNDCATKGMACKNIIGSHLCLCPDGFRRVGTTNNCVDVNECEQHNVCTNGRCVNLDGSFTCQCFEGYIFDEEDKMCLDTRQDVCYVAVHQRRCEVSSTTGLKFTKAECCCNRGKGWGENCEECPSPGTVAFLRQCPHGMGYKPNGDDIDDCLVLPGLCAHGTCINTLGSYRCACDDGYEPSPVTGRHCIDQNECLASTTTCSFDCRNTEGGYECICPKGYQVGSDKSTCVDINECALKQSNCQYVCKNTVGSFKCECPHGFTQEGSQCVDKNECVETPNICRSRGMCQNDPGGYHCECPRGYHRDRNQNCIDVDECGRSQYGRRGPCGGSCRNVPGSYRCSCGNGYMPHGRTGGCQDINECVHSPCSLGQGCINTRGSYECSCGRGTVKTQGGCSDVNECSLGGGSCQYGCSNTYGNFQCGCNRDYFRMGTGHCVRGRGGFQQRIPHYPSFNGFRQGFPMQGMPPPMRGGRQVEDTVCFSCVPHNENGRRHRRSADPEGRFIEVSPKYGKGEVNTSIPIHLMIPNNELTHRTTLLSLEPSLKQMRNHARYMIISGNDDKRFRFHHKGRQSNLKFAKHLRDRDDEVVIEPGTYTITVMATTDMDAEQVRRAAMSTDTIEDAIAEKIQLQVLIHVE